MMRIVLDVLELNYLMIMKNLNLKVNYFKT